MPDWPLLSFLIWLPLLGSVVILIAGERYARWLALGFAVASFLLSVLLYIHYELAGPIFQFKEFHPWIESFGVKINYSLGVDGIAIPLILLNTFMTVLVVIAGWEACSGKAAQYMAAFIIMSGLVNGVFAARDAILFYVFFEAMLIPMFLVIGIWGGERRVYATIKFFLYTFLGSVLFLVSLIAIYVDISSFAMEDLYKIIPTDDNRLEHTFIFFAFLFAFGVKIPMWPIHTWLPDAHVEAPTGGSVILAAITLKVGGYAFLRFVLPVTENAMMSFDWFVIILSLWAIVYIGFVALVQEDIKKLIAYSSIAHMGFVTLGFFLVFQFEDLWPGPDVPVLAIQGGMVQMISHGFISAALFLCIGVLYDRMHTREIKAYGGVANRMPLLAAFFVLFAMANAGLPGTSGFVGEFLVIMASLKASIWIAAAAAFTLIIGAAYMLWLVKRVFYGEVLTDEVDKLSDLNKREFGLLVTLAIAVLWLGLWPQPLTELMGPSIKSLVLDILPLSQSVPVSINGLGE